MVSPAGGQDNFKLSFGGLFLFVSIEKFTNKNEQSSGKRSLSRIPMYIGVRRKVSCGGCDLPVYKPINFY